jgi:pSer/pThr/pTyr-binding forkhead associated (FHA) protein
VGKLVLYLADGATLDVLLARERITIGRRADNDVCLPYPAVSGEHAAVVTILADSFLEDLGSTNGTLVNGKAIAKHFLRDRDEIDIGKQKLVYVADESVQLERDSTTLERVENRIYGEPVEAAPPPPKVAVPQAGSAARAPESASSKKGASSADIERFVAAELGTTRKKQSERTPSAAPLASSEIEAALPRALVRVMTGPSAGREVVIDKDEFAVGRVGIQVAVVRRVDATFVLVPLEGATPPSVNGAPVPPEGRQLRSGDSFEVAGIELQITERVSSAK